MLQDRAASESEHLWALRETTCDFRPLTKVERFQISDLTKGHLHKKKTHGAAKLG